MANIMKMLKLSNHVTRDGFDLQKSLAFTAKPGEFLPIYSRYVMPGDNFKIDGAWRTRTAPLDTSAFTSFKEYYDWYFVPLDLLWNKFNSWFTANKTQVLSASSIDGNLPLSDEHPYFTVSDLQHAVDFFAGSGIIERNNAFGFDRSKLLCKLLHYLGYGDYYNNPSFSSHIVNFKLAPWRLLAYQCIYSHFQRFDQWETIRPETFNIDYLDGSDQQLHIPINDIFKNNVYANGKGTSMLELQYVNWNKDLFMGLLPNSQFGDTASVDLSSIINDVPSATDGFYITNASAVNADVTTSSSKKLSAAGSTWWSLDSNGISAIAKALGLSSQKLTSAFTILALRQAEALQKYKEIQQSNKYDFASQVDAHFGVRPSDAYSRLPMRIGSFDGVIGISDIDNHNITENEDGTLNAAKIAGKAFARGTGKQIEFSAKVPGIIMCCYHVKPILDYALPRIDPDNLKTKFTDYPIPEFDKTGMQQVPLAWMTNRIPLREGYSVDIDGTQQLMGYAPAYIDCKTDIDEVKGAFYNGGLQSWVAPITASYAANWFSQYGDDTQRFRGLNNTFFKVNPRVLNPIFIQDMDDDVSSDKFWIQSHFNIHAVRPIDRQGLPY